MSAYLHTIALFFGLAFSAVVAALTLPAEVGSQIELNTVLVSAFGIVLAAALGVMTKLWFDARADVKEAKRKQDEHAAAVTAQRDAERAESLAARAVLSQEIAVLRERIEPVNTAFLKSLALGLTHAVHQITDDLLLKAVQGTLSLKEEQELKLALEERAANPGPFASETERDAALMFPGVLRRVNAEIALGYRRSLAQEKVKE